MVRPALMNGNTNRNASVVTQTQQAKQVFANALQQSQSCSNRIVAGNSSNTSYSGTTYVETRVGAVTTTCEEKALILARNNCKQ